MPGPPQQQVCCSLGICCSPAEQRTAIAARINAWRTAVTEGGDVDLYLADMLLSTWDLVPYGVGQAVVTLYRPAFQEACGELPPHDGPIEPSDPVEVP